MFDLSWGELVLIGIVALIVIGPKELPTVLRTMGQWIARVRRMASEFQGQFQEAMREAEFEDLKKQVDQIRDPTSHLSDFNPLESTRQEMESAFDGLRDSDKDKQKAGTDAPKTDDPAAGPGPVAPEPSPEQTLASADAPPAPPPEAAAPDPVAPEVATPEPVTPEGERLASASGPGGGRAA